MGNVLKGGWKVPLITEKIRKTNAGFDSRFSIKMVKGSAA